MYIYQQGCDSSPRHTLNGWNDSRDYFANTLYELTSERTNAEVIGAAKRSNRYRWHSSPRTKELRFCAVPACIREFTHGRRGNNDRFTHGSVLISGALPRYPGYTLCLLTSGEEISSSVQYLKRCLPCDARRLYHLSNCTIPNEWHEVIFTIADAGIPNHYFNQVTINSKIE